jgi:hypothetical protein
MENKVHLGITNTTFGYMASKQTLHTFLISLFLLNTISITLCFITSIFVLLCVNKQDNNLLLGLPWCSRFFVLFCFICEIETAWKNSKSTSIQFKLDCEEKRWLREGVIFRMAITNVYWVFIVMPWRLQMLRLTITLGNSTTDLTYKCWVEGQGAGKGLK